MNNLISYCGIICRNCPIHTATRETDKIKKEELIYKIIYTCKALYGLDYKYEDINDCDGCKAKTGRLFIACQNCKIRECATNKGIAGCSYCPEYPCEALTEIFNIEPDTKRRLDLIRKYYT